MNGKRNVSRKTMTMMTMTREELDNLKEHACRNITFVLDKLGISYIQTGGLFKGECPCKFHPGDRDNTGAFTWKEDINHWVCWTHHCEEQWGSDIIGLISGVLELSFNQTILWLQDCLLDKVVKTAGPHTKKQLPKLQQSIDELRLKYLTPYPFYLLNRNFTPKILETYQIGLWSRLGTFMHNRVVVPIRDSDGYLVGFSGRTIYEKEDWAKYQIKTKWIHGKYFDRWPIDGEFNIGTILYNFHNAKHYRKLILTEGPLDVLRLVEAGMENAVCMFGTSLTNHQRNLLVQHGINEVILALDPDEAGQAAAVKLERQLSDLFYITTLQLSNDPGDMSVMDIRKEFNEAHHD